MPKKDFAGQFKAVFERAIQVANQEKESLTNRLEEHTTKLEELDDEIQGIEKSLAEVDTNFVVGLKHAGREAGLKLDFTTKPQPIRKGISRRIDVHLEAAMDRVDAVLPANGERHLPTREIAERAGVDRQTVKDVLVRLRSENRAETNGKRGLVAGWRRAG